MGRPVEGRLPMAVLPRLIRPMLATLRRGLPADQDRYGWEFKWDGVRAIAYVSGGEVRLVSRNDKEMAASYPELAVLAWPRRRPGDPGRGADQQAESALTYKTNDDHPNERPLASWPVSAVFRPHLR